MERTGVFATVQETQQLKELVALAQNTPVIALSSKHALERGGFAGDAWQTVKETCHAIALKHGLPEIEGFYGLTNDREFVKV